MEEGGESPTVVEGPVGPSPSTTIAGAIHRIAISQNLLRSRPKIAVLIQSKRTRILFFMLTRRVR